MDHFFRNWNTARHQFLVEGAEASLKNDYYTCPHCKEILYKPEFTTVSLFLRTVVLQHLKGHIVKKQEAEQVVMVDERDIHSMEVPDDFSNEVCSICLQPLEMYFSHSMDAWMLLDCRKKMGIICHAECFDHYGVI
jgi:hypothetical protein